MFIRFLRFNLVSALGIVVQLAVVALLVTVFRVHYLVASALAVETAVLHNFAWHERWTWRVPAARGGVFFRCAAFHAGNGCVSLLGTLALMPALAHWLGWHHLPCNLVTIAATGLLNFLLSDRLIFRSGSDEAEASPGTMAPDAFARPQQP